MVHVKGTTSNLDLQPLACSWFCDSTSPGCISMDGNGWHMMDYDGSKKHASSTKIKIVKGVCWEDLSDMYQRISKNIPEEAVYTCLHHIWTKNVSSNRFTTLDCQPFASARNPRDTNSKLLVLILQHLTTRNCVPALVPSFSPAFAAFTEASWRSCISGLWVNGSICIINHQYISLCIFLMTPRRKTQGTCILHH